MFLNILRRIKVDKKRSLGQNRHMALRVKSGIFEKLVPVLVVLSIGLAFMVGVLWQKVSNLEKGGVTSGTSGTTNTTTAQQPAATTVSLSTIKGLFGQNLIKFGDANKKLLFVEVVDPSCPYCHAAGGYDPELGQQMGAQFTYASKGGSYDPPALEMEKLVQSGQASMAFIFFPGHGNGEMGMKALYCAFDQGKFWQANALLMSNAGYNLMNNTVKNDKTQSGAVADFLKSAVDATALKSCLDSGKYDARLTSEQALATSLGVQGTPGFFINATAYPGAYNWTDMKSTVDSAIK